MRIDAVLDKNRQREAQERSKRRMIDSALVPDPGGDVPKYLTMRRKEVRMPDEMIEELYSIARQLMDQRPSGGQGEQITPSTVVRLCIGYTLHRLSDGGRKLAMIRGDDEDELLTQFIERLD